MVQISTMKKLLLFGALALSSISFSQEVVSTQGDSYTNASGSIDFTIGEVVINTGTDGTNDLTQGFHQTNWNFLGVDNHEQNFEATVYPNPMGTELYIQTESFEYVSYIIYDATGRIVAENKLNALQTGIDVSTFAPSSYSLVLRNENQEKVKTFKLVKTH
ncbi:MAG: hypothetical protein ACI837_002871 [Crocinitomicaceae bacterium]|jgi:hypothetical protein